MIRASTPADVPALHALIRELARYEKLEHAHVGSEERLARAPLRRAAGTARRWSPRTTRPRPGASSGFALFFHNYSTFLAQPGIYLEDLFVLPTTRRRGHGRDLLRAVARLAVERGCGRFEWSVLHWNEPAIRFYKALGATPLDEWRLFRLTGEALTKLGQ